MSEATNSGLKTTSSWQKNGSGPKPTEGGEWVSGAALKPSSVPPSNAVITTIDYWWDDDELGDWADQVSVRLLLEAGTSQYYVDISSPSESSVDLTSVGFPADCTIWFQMKVGSCCTLYDPPYIMEDQVTVHYEY
ncbi:hypothetical protein KX75_20110 [Salmonella enterica subsp. enterica]|nr:hypothetical protein [Salmonella enterica subsp. enterica serovar Mikawasima]EDN7229179.1 flagellar protein FlhE [Salmonella enterica subsp. enterica serovar Mikawasima]